MVFQGPLSKAQGSLRLSNIYQLVALNIRQFQMAIKFFKFKKKIQWIFFPHHTPFCTLSTIQPYQLYSYITCCGYSCEHLIVTRNALRILVCKKTLECQAGKWPGWGQAGQQLACFLDNHVTLHEAKDEKNCAGIESSCPALSLRGPPLHTIPILSPLTQDLPDQLDTD
jgi:hypothetical protein